jgi:hypothetical protein
MLHPISPFVIYFTHNLFCEVLDKAKKIVKKNFLRKFILFIVSAVGAFVPTRQKNKKRAQTKRSKMVPTTSITVSRSHSDSSLSILSKTFSDSNLSIPRICADIERKRKYPKTSEVSYSEPLELP